MFLGFTDLHFDGLNGRIQDTYKWLCYNIEKEKPDMVIILGDTALCWGNRGRAKEVAEIMKAYGVYWSLVLGNHEGESHFELSRKGFMKLMSSYDNCLAAVSIDGVNGYGIISSTSWPPKMRCFRAFTLWTPATIPITNT